ncbi:MAG: hypothetical protein JW904_04300, partial [Spirochaetales bacterium]|nr:hypothetical protein [Spirochaetales bacterium]
MKMKYGFIIFLALILCQNLVAGEFEFEWHKLPVMPAGLKTIIIRTGDNLLAEKAEYQNGRIIKSYLTFDNGKMWILATSYEYENDLLVYETDYLGGKVKALRINTYDKNKRLTETKQYSVRNDIETLADIISCEYNQKGHMIHRIKKD